MRHASTVLGFPHAAIGRLATVVAGAGLVAALGLTAAPAAAGNPAIEPGSWFPAPVCDGTICTTASSDDLPRVGVVGRGFSPAGEVLVGFYRPQAAAADASYGATADDLGKFEVATPQPDCSTTPSPRAVAYEVQAVDLTTGLWSNVAAVTLCGPATQ